MDRSEQEAKSPYGIFLEYCAKGKLAFQRGSNGQAVFYPRIAAPRDGGALNWEVSAGRGTIYSVTIVRPRGEEAFALVLVDIDEGFRMMSRIDTERPEEVGIGDTVNVGFRSLAEGQPQLPVFTLVKD